MNYDLISNYYDKYVNFTLDIPFFIKESTRTKGSVLELMCGTGRVTLPLIEAGVSLSAVDVSRTMLQILKNKLEKHGLSATIFQQDIRGLNLGRNFDLIFLPFHSFTELETTSDQNKALKSVYEHLNDGGRFICTLHNPAIRLKTVTGQLRLLGKYPLNTENSLLVWCAENYNPLEKIVVGVQIYEEYDNQGKMRSRTVIELKFALIDKTQFESLVNSAGFEISNTYGDYSYSEFNEASSPVMIFVIQKKRK